MTLTSARRRGAVVFCVGLGLAACSASDGKLEATAPQASTATPVPVDASGLPILDCAPGVGVESGSFFLAPDFKGGESTPEAVASRYLARNYPNGFKEAPPQEVLTRPTDGTGYFAVGASEGAPSGRAALGYMTNSKVIVAFAALESTAGGGWALEEFRICADVSKATR